MMIMDLMIPMEVLMMIMDHGINHKTLLLVPLSQDSQNVPLTEKLTYVLLMEENLMQNVLKKWIKDLNNLNKLMLIMMVGSVLKNVLMSKDIKLMFANGYWMFVLVVVTGSKLVKSLTVLNKLLVKKDVLLSVTVETHGILNGVMNIICGKLVEMLLVGMILTLDVGIHPLPMLLFSEQINNYDFVDLLDNNKYICIFLN